MFKLSHFREKLLKWITTAPYRKASLSCLYIRFSLAVIPDSPRNHLISFLTEGINDISVSRPFSRLQWGVRVPNDHNHTVRGDIPPSTLTLSLSLSSLSLPPSLQIYVWLDALVNYLTVSGFPKPGHFWPATDHVIGKDILKFHCIYWPSFLMALDIDLPDRIVVHSHWTIEKSKVCIDVIVIIVASFSSPSCLSLS